METQRVSPAARRPAVTGARRESRGGGGGKSFERQLHGEAGAGAGGKERPADASECLGAKTDRDGHHVDVVV